MARRTRGFDNAEMVLAAKAVDPTYIVATNFEGPPPREADVAIHFSHKVPGKPYIETEGVPDNARGGYWFHYSKSLDADFDKDSQEKSTTLYNYLNVGIYSEDMKANQLHATVDHLSRGEGYMLASTWLQAVPPEGPNHRPGGLGGKQDPGIRWWLEFIKGRFGA